MDASTQSLSNKPLTLLSRLLFPRDVNAQSAAYCEELAKDLLALTRSEFDDLVALADLNHVVVRALDAMLPTLRNANDTMRSGWAEEALLAERSRIANAVPVLRRICAACESQGYEVAVIKSLDHWPDLGSDLDLFTSASPKQIIDLMRQQFQAEVAPRSWGDRLACKWNFLIPGLPEAVEVHVGRLGQTGEQATIAGNVLRRARRVQVDGTTFWVPSVSDRLMVSTLQRMYRHFYFRLCDIVDSAQLADSGQIDYADLQNAATMAGIWEGVAAYLAIVSDYVKKYRGTGLDLPRSVRSAARFGGEVVYFGRGFLRVPILPQSAGLYRTQLAGMLRKREITNGARLSLLPWLATAAVVGQKITGSDKGIW